MDLNWMGSSIEKATRIKDLLIEEFDGETAQYDFFTGCYGNPDANLVFISETPSLTPKKIVAEAYSKNPQKLWTTAWKVKVHDLLFRIALYRNGRIDDPLSDEPWKWKCWITDFVKRGEYTYSWNKLDKVKRRRVIKESGKLLERELRILSEEPQPVKCVIFVGHRSESYFEKNLKGLDSKLGFRSKTVYHYAWPKSEEQRKTFFDEFKKALQGCPR